MNRKLLATTSISIHATQAEVWEALVNPSIISHYFHGTETVSDWKLGSPITFKGEWQGKPYLDKGTILEINPERVLSYSFWSSLSGTDDFEDNYAHVTYHLSHYNENTTLIITQDNLDTDEEVVKAEDNWMNVSQTIKNLVEQNSKSQNH